MKIFKKITIIVLMVVCFAIIGNGIYLSRMGKTVDCVGVVDFVNVETKTIKITDMNHVEYLLKVEFYTSLKDLNNDKINMNEIEVGDHITANYRGKWKGSEHALTATYIKVVK